MGGALDWHAMPVVTEMLGINDIETFVHRLAAIRDWHAEHRD